MTDARIPGHWVGSPKFDSLSAGAWALFARALAWSNEQGTDGRIPDAYLPLIMMCEGIELEHAAELGAAGIWDRETEAWQFVGWNVDPHKGGLGQRSAFEVRKQRDASAERMRLSRERRKQHEAGDHSGCDPRKCEGARDALAAQRSVSNVQRNVARNVGEGKGEGYYGVTHSDSKGAPVDDDYGGWISAAEDVDGFSGTDALESPSGASAPDDLDSRVESTLAAFGMSGRAA